jgi:glycosyltransferase involved in cell wall biosynthesis
MGIPEITLLLPVYNGEPYLREAIQSALVQTYNDFEFVIIDDGSSDKSLEVIAEFHDVRMKFFPREHQGMDGQLNWATKNIKSPFIAMMEQDNILTPDRLELQFDAIMENTMIDVISSSYITIDAAGVKQEIRWLPKKDEDIRELFPIFCPIAFGSVLVRREKIIQAGGFNSFYFPNNDYELWLRMLPVAMFANIEKPLLYKRRHSEAATVVQGESAQRQRLEISSNYLEKEIEKSADPKEKSKLKFKLALCHYYNGSMKDARRILFCLVGHLPDRGRFWRYYLMTFLGDTLMKLLRRKGIAHRATNILRRHRHLGRYISP